MARIRTIKPEFPQSESMGNVSRDARLTFLQLWTIADDEGRLRGNSRMLASLLFPYDDDAPALIDEWLSELEGEGCIQRYKAASQSYVQICNWLIHQKIDKPSKSKLPEFESIREDSRGVVVGPRTKDQGPKDQGEDQGGEGDQGEDLPFASAKAAPPKKSELDPERKAACREAWESYSAAYLDRYQAEPVRNAKVNRNIVDFVARLGFEESPHVAAFYVSHNGAHYVRAMHSVGLMLQDAEKLRTEWVTGNRMTATRAQQVDRTQTNFDAFAPLIAAAEAEDNHVES